MEGLAARAPMEALESLLPAVVLLGVALGGIPLYLMRNWVRGPFHDAEVEARGSTALLSMPVRLYFAWLVGPIWRGLVAIRIPATAVTTLSVILACGSGFAAGGGHFALAGWLFLTAGLCDFLDGRLARKLKTASRQGAAFDSIMDRYSDAAFLVGLAWYFRGTWVLLAALAALMGSMLISYIRARGESLGVAFKNVGLLQRPERVVLLGVTMAFSQALELVLPASHSDTPQRLAAFGIIFVGAATHITALHRLYHLLTALSEPGPAPSSQQPGRPAPSSVPATDLRRAR